ncbi:MAG: hypothetical protein HZA93_15640 [Verrucomicrobia bacterium]|nr:hypothetical protein [Verrucomicrobiota bacterium]
MKLLAVAVVVIVFGGCSRVAKEKPAVNEIVGMWMMTKLDPSSYSYLASSGASVDESKKPTFEIRKDGSVSVSRLPLDIAAGKAITVDAIGKWHLLRPTSEDQGWTFHFILSEPKRGFHYDFRHDSRGLLLRGSFDPEDPGCIEFRRNP